MPWMRLWNTQVIGKLARRLANKYRGLFPLDSHIKITAFAAGGMTFSRRPKVRDEQVH
jgi:hypothetical protein